MKRHFTYSKQKTKAHELGALLALLIFAAGFFSYVRVQHIKIRDLGKAQPVYAQAAPNNITFVQQNATGTSGTIAPNVILTAPVTAGSLLVLSVNIVGDITHSINSVTDTQGNTWVQAIAKHDHNDAVFVASQELWYAANARAGATTITANLNATLGATNARLYAHEYQGVATLNPLDQTSWAIGFDPPPSANVISPSRTTFFPNELIFAGSETWGTPNPGPGFTTRGTLNLDYTEDKNVSTVGSNNAIVQVASCGGNCSWMIQMATFRASAQPNPVRFYKMDEGSGSTVLDSSVFNAPGTSYGSPLPTYITGVGPSGTALYFNNASQWIESDWPPSPSLDIRNDFTITAWVNFSSVVNTYPRIFQKGRQIASPTAFSLGINTPGGVLRPEVRARIGGTEYSSVDPSNMSINTWHHIAGVRNGTSLKILVDGVLKNTVAIPAGTIDLNSGQTAYLGGGPVDGRMTDGGMDEVHVSARALSDAEVLAEYQSYDNQPPSPIVNLSPADAATGVSINPTLTATTASDATPPIQYNFELFTTPGCSGAFTQARGYAASTSWIPSTLTMGTTYYWHYRARDSAASPNASGFSACTSFTVVSDTNPPTGVGNVSPADASAGISINPTLVAATASDATTPVLYNFELWSGAGCTGTLLQSVVNYAPTNWSPTTLAYGTTYYWRNRARDSVTPTPNQSAYGPCWAFTTSLVGPVAYWPFNGNAQDATGNGYNGTLQNGPGYVAGRVNQAIGMNGISQRVDMANPASGLTDIPAKTIIAWINMSSGSGNTYKDILVKGDAGCGWWLSVMNSSFVHWGQCFSSGTYGSWGSPAGSITANQWYQVAVTYDNSSAANIPTFYINGSPTALTTIGSPIGTVSSDAPYLVSAGGEIPNNNENFGGTIDEVRLYNRVLSAAEISSIYAADAAAVCGNNLKETGETCDGADLAGASCTTLGYFGGTLSCNPTCTGYVTSSCTNCGNNTIQAGETCDGTNLNGQTCISQGFAGGGTLACNASCTAFNTGACIAQTCGNNLREGSETCDGTDLAGQSCTTVPGGYIGGTLSCQPSCAAFNTASCTPPPVTTVPDQSALSTSDLRPVDAGGNSIAGSWERDGANVVAIKVWAPAGLSRSFEAVYTSPTINTIFYTYNNAANWACSHTYTPGWNQISCPTHCSNNRTIACTLGNNTPCGAGRCTSDCDPLEPSTTWRSPFSYTGNAAYPLCRTSYPNFVGSSAKWIWGDSCSQNVVYCRLEFGIDLGGGSPYQPGAYCGDGIAQTSASSPPGPEECDNGSNNGACPKTCSSQCLRNDCTCTGPLCSGCFITGTKVLTPSGPRDINDLNVGDPVVSYDEATKQKAIAYVELPRSYSRDHYYVLNGTIRVTKEHRFAVVDAEGTITWKPVMDLSIGDRFVLDTGKTISLASKVLHTPAQSIQVFNPALSYPHTYYIWDGAEYILVHNAKCTTPRCGGGP